MNIAIGAIFKDEFDYLLEWIAYYRIAGFTQIIVADNGSTDGTREFLEAAKMAGFLHLLYQPPVERFAQVRAYNRIAEYAEKMGIDVIFFLDADEFLVHESFVNGAEEACIRGLFANDFVGSIGVNWRCFGSSGLLEQDDRLVIERFQHCASDDDLGIGIDIAGSVLNNCNIKSVTRLNVARKFDVHVSFLQEGFLAVDSRGVGIDDYIWPVDGKYVRSVLSPIRENITLGPLRINHYIVKSKGEYNLKKRRRGDAQSGPDFDRGEEYFYQHDYSGDYFNFPQEKVECVKREMQLMANAVNCTIYGAPLRGNIDIFSEDEIYGWVCSESDVSQDIFVSVFVNSIYVGISRASLHRRDVLVAGVSSTPYCGFRFTHALPMKSGDVVECHVLGNSFKFKNWKKVF